MSYQHLLLHNDDGIRTVTFNRPDRLNAWNAQMRAEFREVVEQTAVDRDTRVLILTGAGRAFSAGEDVAGMEELADSGTRGFRTTARTMHSVFDAVEEMEVPVIAAIEGVAAGGGLELALSCDFRVLGEGAKLVMPERNVGLIPGSGGCSRLVRYVGLGRAKEMVMLGRPTDAARAMEFGLATDVVPAGSALEKARELARDLTAAAPLAVGMAKMILNSCTDVDAETGRRLERLGQSVLKTTADHREGFEAFLAKRRPTWTGS